MESLSTTQQFELEQMKRAAQSMSREQAQDLLIQAAQLLMVKNNVYRELLRQSR
jgi:hypothetical protein